MGLRRGNGCSLSAALAFLFFFATAIGICLGGIGRREEEAASGRRLLIGLGSSPPTCRWRCGQCFPCRPVHVTIEPGRSIPLEYYPEAWRCKCGDKLFMP